jgi:hypothetical protein
VVPHFRRYVYGCSTRLSGNVSWFSEGSESTKCTCSRDSSVSIVTILRARRPWFNSRQGQRWDLLTTMSRPALMPPPQPPIQWVPWALPLRLKRSGCEADHSSPSNSEVKNAWNYTSTPSIRLHGVVPS